MYKGLGKGDVFLYSREGRSTKGRGVHPKLAAFPHLLEISFCRRRRAMPSHVYSRPGLQIMYLHSGTTRWTLGDRLVTLKMGEALLTGPAHAFGGEWGSVSPCVMSWILVRPKRFSKNGKLQLGPWSSLTHAEEKNIGSRLVSGGPLHLKSAEFWEPLFLELRRELDGNRWSRTAQTNRLLSLIFFQAFRKISKEKNEPSSETETRKLAGLDAALVSRLDEPWTTDLMGRAIELRVSELSRFLKTQTGLSPNRYLLFVRIRESKRLLREGKPLTRIALDCGFSSQQHFSTAFKKITGYSPSRWPAEPPLGL